MINAITGDIVSIKADRVCILCNGIEYELLVSGETASKLSNLPSQDRIGYRMFTHLSHKEDAMILYGFHSEIEREVFRQLITVPGIGAKGALKILSGISIPSLINLLDSGDAKMLAKVPGVGPKTSQKMILALRNVLVLDTEQGTVKNSTSGIDRKYSDLVNSLCDMGYDRKTVERQLAVLLEEHENEISAMDNHKAEEFLFRNCIVAMG